MRTRSRTTHVLVMVLLAILVALAATMLAGCDGAVDDTGTDEATDARADDQDGETDDSDDSDEGDAEDTESNGSDTADDGQVDGQEADARTVRVYFAYAGGNALAIERTVTGDDTRTLAQAALAELLAGPTEDELATWPALGTEVPEEADLLGVELDGGVAKVDLSGDFEEGGGTSSMTSRLAQVVYTLTDLEGVDSVEFFLDGEKADVFSGEGIVIEEPQTREDFEELVPIDA